MNKQLLAMEDKIREAYEGTVTIMECEALAAETLHLSMQLTREIENVDLDRRMRKSGLKTIKASILLKKASDGEKRTVSILEAIVESDPLVTDSQDALDRAEVHYNRLSATLDLLRESHIYFRGRSRGVNI